VNELQSLSSVNESLYGDGRRAATVISHPRRAALRGPAERLFNQSSQSGIANTTIMVIEFHYRSGQSSGNVGGTRRAADSSEEV
jgi:hypothetical protein